MFKLIIYQEPIFLHDLQQNNQSKNNTPNLTTIKHIK